MTAQELFDSLTPEERSQRCAISYTPDAVFLHFGSLPDPGVTLTDEQIKQLPAEWQERYAKAQADAAIKDCVLLAGEETQLIVSGSLYYCKQLIGQLPHRRLPRDSYSGKGCWAIVQGDKTLTEGYFDNDMAW